MVTRTSIFSGIPAKLTLPSPLLVSLFTVPFHSTVTSAPFIGSPVSESRSCISPAIATILLSIVKSTEISSPFITTFFSVVSKPDFSATKTISIPMGIDCSLMFWPFETFSGCESSFPLKSSAEIFTLLTLSPNWSSKVKLICGLMELPTKTSP